jgi:hypothetical protein
MKNRRLPNRIMLGLCATLMLSVGGSIFAQPAALATSTAQHGYMSACSVATNADARIALHEDVATKKPWSTGGFSQCIFVGASGTFVLFDIASTSMLTKHYGKTVTALMEFQAIKSGGFPAALKHIGPNMHLVNGPGYAVQSGDVVILTTMGTMHTYHHISHPIMRLRQMLEPISIRLFRPPTPIVK